MRRMRVWESYCLTSSSSRTISWKCNERCKNLTMPKNLANYLLKQPKPNKGKEKDFEPRFSSIFDDFDLLMATAQHFHFKLGVVGRLNEGKYPSLKMKILEEIKCNIASKFTPP